MCERSGNRSVSATGRLQRCLLRIVNAVNSPSTEHALALRPLVDSGQILLANHSWSHPDVTTISSTALADQITRNDQFLRPTYGVAPEPFFRPPYGNHNTRTDRVAADLGHPTITMREGGLGDSSVVTEEYLLEPARQWFQSAAHRHRARQPLHDH